VFFNRFFEAVSFGAILVAHGTHGHSQKLVEIVKFEADCRERGRGIGKGQ